MGRREGQKQRPGLARGRAESVSLVERGCPIVLGIDQQGDGVRRVLNGPMNRVYEHQARRDRAGGQILRPFLRAVQDTDDVNSIAGYSVHHQVGQRRKHKLPRSLLLASASTVGEIHQDRGGVLDFPHQERRPCRRVLKQIVGYAFQVGGSFFGPAKLHLRVGLLF